MKRDTASGNLQSVGRALRALELIAESGELGVTELGRLLDVHKATASRLIADMWLTHFDASLRRGDASRERARQQR